MKYDRDGINLNTKAVLVTEEKLKEELYGSKEDLKIIRMLELYTQLVHKSIFIRIMVRILARRNNIEISRIKYNKENKNYQYILDDGVIIPFDLISKHIVEAPQSLKKELSSLKRAKKCHERTLEICRSFENSIVHTGLIILGENQYLHTVLEFKDKYGKDIIVDWTRNLWIDKEEYIKLFKFNILESIKSEDISNDAEFLKHHLPNTSLKVYLTFRDELMKDINRNQSIFKQEEKPIVKTKVNH